MPIVVDHSQGTSRFAGANVAGQGELQNQADQISLDAARIDLQAAQREQEVAINAELRLQGQAADQQRLAVDVAMRQQAQTAAAAAQRANLEAQLFRAAMQDQNVLQQLAMRNDFAMQAQTQQDAEKQIGDELAALRKANLDPQGRRLYSELFAKRQEIMGRRDLPPAVREDLLGQWAEDFGQADLWSYEQKEPTAWDDFEPMGGQQVQPGQPLPPGFYMRTTGERNGVVQREPFHVFGPEGPPTRPAPDGGLMIMQPDGKWDYQAPIKQEQPKPDPNAPRPLKPDERVKFIDQAFKQLDAIARNKANYESKTDAKGNAIPGQYVPPDYEKDVLPLAEKMIRAAGGDDDQQAAAAAHHQQSTMPAPMPAPQPQPQAQPFEPQPTETPVLTIFDPQPQPGTAYIDMVDGYPRLWLAQGNGAAVGLSRGRGTADDPISFGKNVRDDQIAAMFDAAPSNTVFINPATGEPVVK